MQWPGTEIGNKPLSKLILTQFFRRWYICPTSRNWFDGVLKCCCHVIIEKMAQNKVCHVHIISGNTMSSVQSNIQRKLPRELAGHLNEGIRTTPVVRNHWMTDWLGRIYVLLFSQHYVCFRHMSRGTCRHRHEEVWAIWANIGLVPSGIPLFHDLTLNNGKWFIIPIWWW